MKQAEMGTDLIDHLTPEEKSLLSRLNPEISELKEKLIACKTDRIEVSELVCACIGIIYDISLTFALVLAFCYWID